MSSDKDKPPVVKLAQPGYDVHTAGDEHMIYDSRWPLLKIHKEGSYLTKNIGVQNIIVDHDLGYPPFFWYFANTPINAWEVISAGQEARSEFMGPLGDGNMEVSDKRLIFQPNSAFPAVTGLCRLYFYVYALDLTKQFTAPIVKLGGIIGPRADEHVFKIAREGKDVSSDDLMDFVLHSRCRSPLIHSVNPSGAVVKAFTVQHNLGYQPMFFGFIKTARGTYQALYTGQGGSSSFQADDQKISFADSGGKEITIVVLKDPFTLSESVSVTV